jgi:hypothetical protein
MLKHSFPKFMDRGICLQGRGIQQCSCIDSLMNMCVRETYVGGRIQVVSFGGVVLKSSARILVASCEREKSNCCLV